MSATTRQLKQIATLCDDLLSYAKAGGKKTHAFDLLIDEKEIGAFEHELQATVWRIQDELGE